ncbi:hypothetical protein ABPG74_005317 [Tetrahymena malaccensis]
MRSIFAFILIFAVVFGTISNQRISVPLKINDKQQLFFTVKYGEKQCQVDLIPAINFCSNVITEPSQVADQCGSVYIGENNFVKSRDYSAKFQLGNTQTNLQFSVPNGSQSMFYGAQELCFGFQNYAEQQNTLIELFQSGQLTEERFYVGLNNAQTSSASAGYLDIGAANESQIKAGSDFVKLSTSTGESQYSTNSNRNLNYGSQKLQGGSIVFFSLDSPFTQLSIFAFQDLLSAFSQQGVEYTYLPDQDYAVYLNSIEQLQNITLGLVAQDGSAYNVTLTSQQYTKQLNNSQYQLLIVPQFYTNSITLGYPVFESYYVGFDLPHRQILIVEKAQQNTFEA